MQTLGSWISYRVENRERSRNGQFTPVSGVLFDPFCRECFVSVVNCKLSDLELVIQMRVDPVPGPRCGKIIGTQIKVITPICCNSESSHHIVISSHPKNHGQCSQYPDNNG